MVQKEWKIGNNKTHSHSYILLPIIMSSAFGISDSVSTSRSKEMSSQNGEGIELPGYKLHASKPRKRNMS